MELRGWMVTVLFEELPNCFPEWLSHCIFSQATEKDFNFFMSYITLSFNSSHPGEYYMASHVGLIYLSLMINDVEHVFMYFLVVHILPLKNDKTNSSPIFNSITFLLVTEL